MDRRTITLQLYPGRDDKISHWYDAIEGNKQDALKAAILCYIDRDMAVETVAQPDASDVLPLREVFIQGFKELIRQERLTRKALKSLKITVAAGATVQTGELTQEEIRRRETNLRKSQQW